jgi:hypothetical protein
MCYNYFFLLLDKGLIEYIGPFGIYNLLTTVAKKIQKLHTGYLYNYFFYTFIVFLFYWL